MATFDFGHLVTVIVFVLYIGALIYSVWAYWWSKKHTKFSWVQNMILLCLLSNVQGLYADAHDVFTGWNAISEAILTFLDVAPFYAFQNAIYWLFGFKYWVIGKEVPDMLNEK
jgi:hypothetical protein